MSNQNPNNSMSSHDRNKPSCGVISAQRMHSGLYCTYGGDGSRGFAFLRLAWYLLEFGLHPPCAFVAGSGGSYLPQRRVHTHRYHCTRRHCDQPVASARDYRGQVMRFWGAALSWAVWAPAVASRGAGRSRRRARAGTTRSCCSRGRTSWGTTWCTSRRPRPRTACGDAMRDGFTYTSPGTRRAARQARRAAGSSTAHSPTPAGAEANLTFALVSHPPPNPGPPPPSSGASGRPANVPVTTDCRVRELALRLAAKLRPDAVQAVHDALQMCSLCSATRCAATDEQDHRRR